MVLRVADTSNSANIEAVDIHIYQGLVLIIDFVAKVSCLKCVSKFIVGNGNRGATDDEQFAHGLGPFVLDSSASHDRIAWGRVGRTKGFGVGPVLASSVFHTELASFVISFPFLANSYCICNYTW